MRYHHTQNARGRLLWPAAVTGIATVGIVEITVLVLAPKAWLMVALVCVIIPVIFAGVIYVFGSLTIEVSDRHLRWYFARGFWTTTILLSDIARVEPFGIPGWYSVGIRYVNPAWVYCVAAGDGIEVRRKDGGIVRLSTDDQAGLLRALAERLA